MSERYTFNLNMLSLNDLVELNTIFKHNFNIWAISTNFNLKLFLCLIYTYRNISTKCGIKQNHFYSKILPNEFCIFFEI